MTTYQYLYLLLFLFIIQACEPANPLAISTDFDTVPLQIKGAYQGPDEADFVDFTIYIGAPQEDEFGSYYYWNADVSESELGATLIAGAYTSKFTFDPVTYFGLQFWSDQLPADRQWTSEELEQFFTPGTVFELGQGSGLVDVSFRYPEVDDFGSLDDIPSKSSFLAHPEGQLLVTDIQEYQFEGIRPSGNREVIGDGKLISCIVNAEVGLNRDTPIFRNTDTFLTDEVLELREVEVTFYVAY
jgi:hypothetical protein